LLASTLTWHTVYTWARTGLVGLAFNLYVAGFTGTPTLSGVFSALWEPRTPLNLAVDPAGGCMGTALYGLVWARMTLSRLTLISHLRQLVWTCQTLRLVAWPLIRVASLLVDICTRVLPGGCSASGGTGLVGAAGNSRPDRRCPATWSGVCLRWASGVVATPGVGKPGPDHDRSSKLASSLQPARFVFPAGKAYPADSGSSICSRGVDPAWFALLRGLSRLMMSQ
jgi:hypothetical protein